MHIIFNYMIAFFLIWVLIPFHHGFGNDYPHGIIVDTSMGLNKPLQLTGPEYEILSTYGVQKLNTLFHSFSQFNLHESEKATFKGPSSIHQIIARVTNGNPTWLDGHIKCNIDHTDLYFINPHGIFVGPNISLDLDGSFYLTTADYIRMADHQNVFSDENNPSYLSSAQPEAFGFIDNDIAPIYFDGHGNVNVTDQPIINNSAGIHVLPNQSITVVGGDIWIQQGSFYYKDGLSNNISEDSINTQQAIQLGNLTAPGGMIQLISVASKGEISINDTPLLSNMSNYGKISLYNKALLNVSGSTPGKINLFANQILLSDSDMIADLDGPGQGGIINLQGNVIEISNGSRLIANNYGTGQGSAIHILANQAIHFFGENIDQAPSQIISQSFSQLSNGGPAGDIMIQSLNDSIYFTDGATISKNAYGSGNSGSITLKSFHDIIFSGSSTLGHASKILMNTFFKESNAGHGSDLSIFSNNIIFQDGAFIASGTIGGGNGGHIHLKANDFIRLSGMNHDPFASQYAEEILGFKHSGFVAGIFGLVTMDSSGGHGGNILLESNHIITTDGALIFTNTFGSGNGGNITIHALGTVTLLDAIDVFGLPGGISCSANAVMPGAKTGYGGNIKLNAGELIVKNGAYIASSSVAFPGGQSGHAGKVDIHVKGTITLSGVNPYGENDHNFESGIYARTKGIENNAGSAGQIVIHANNLILEKGGIITSGTNNNANGGNIDIHIQNSIVIDGTSPSISIQTYGLSQLKYQYYFDHYELRKAASGIYAVSENASIQKGKGGEISLCAKQLNIDNSGIISTSTFSGGSAGNIFIHSDTIFLSRHSSILSESTSKYNGGPAGTITINASHTMRMKNNSSLTTEAVNTQNSDSAADQFNGKIVISIGKGLYFNDSHMSTQVKSGSGNGGDIDMISDFDILNNSQIIANAYEGNGGNIHIISNHHIQSSDSIVDASSQLGIDGMIHIDSPDIDLANRITLLASNFLNAEQWITTPCRLRSDDTISRIIITRKEAHPDPIDDWKSSPVCNYQFDDHDHK